MIEKISLSIKILLTILLVSAMFCLGKIGVADFLLLAPRAYVEAVQSGRERLDPAELVKARGRLLSAYSWDKRNPVIPEFLGHIAFIRASLFRNSPVLQSFFLKEAIFYFDAALAVRPNSAILWGNRMVIASEYIDAQSAQGGNSSVVQSEWAKMSMALRRAAILAPWDISVINQLVKIGKLRYPQLSLEDRRTVDEAIRKMSQLNLNG